MDNDDAVGTGGYGVVITSNGQQIDQISGGFSFTTNARMDIMGITEGLKKIKEPSNIVVYLSNGYVIDTLTKGWLGKWKKNGFKKKKHVDLWMELDKVLQENIHTISYKHSREVQNSKDLQLAEQLGKTMSGKKNLPNDLRPNESGGNLFQETGTTQSEILDIEDDRPILDSICVDASTIENPGITEYRGVDTRTGQVLFQHKYDEATNNIGEFLAIVHALALYKKQGKELKIIYSAGNNNVIIFISDNCSSLLYI